MGLLARHPALSVSPADILVKIGAIQMHPRSYVHNTVKKNIYPYSTVTETANIPIFSTSHPISPGLSSQNSLRSKVPMRGFSSRPVRNWGMEELMKWKEMGEK